MLANIPVPVVGLLHEGGWDEALMVAVGLILAYGIIMWTGRRSRDDEDDEDDEISEGELPADDAAPMRQPESTQARGDDAPGTRS